MIVRPRTGLVNPTLVASLALCVLALLALAGCAGTTNAQSASSLVRARPTTPPETYTLQQNGAVTALRDALDKLAIRLADPHYFDDTWKSDAVNFATIVELGYRELEGLTPPDANREQHAQLVQAVQDCQTLTVYVFQGINNLDKGPFDEVKQRVDLCRDKLRVATDAPGSIEAQKQPANVEAARREISVTTKRDANLRGGPGTAYEVVGAARTWDKFTVVGRTAKGDWLQVNGDRARGWWIAAFLVEADGDLQAAPVITPSAPPPVQQVVISTPTP